MVAQFFLSTYLLLGAFPQSEYVWKLLNSDPGFSKTYNYQLFAGSDRIYAFHPDGVLESRDGRTWQKTGLRDIVGNQAFLDYVEFKGAIFALGTFNGNIERFSMTTQIARTADFRSWRILAKDSNIPRRFFYHPFVFRGEIWIVGGEDGTQKFDDAWASPDGVHWRRVADHLPFGKRAGQRFLVFKEKLFMLDHDVWVSSDGLAWSRLTAEIAEGNIYGYSTEVFDGKIWLIGCSRDGKFGSEVLTSQDGMEWQAMRAPWSPRGGVATCVFRDELIMTGGKYGGPGIAGQTEFVYSNDVWGMKRVRADPTR